MNNNNERPTRRQRIILSNKTEEPTAQTSQPVRENTIHPARFADIETGDEIPWAIIGGIIAVGVLVNLMVWCLVFLAGR